MMRVFTRMTVPRALALHFAALWSVDRMQNDCPLLKTELKALGEGYSKENLESSGVTLLPRALSKVQMEECKKLECYLKMQQFVQNGQAMDARMQRQLAKEIREGTEGRYHKTQFTSEELKFFDSLQEAWMPRVREYLGAKRRIYRSQTQLLFSEPGSSFQFFHQDNARKGLTLIIPLVDVKYQMGPTQLLRGTHKMSEARQGDRTWGESLQAFWDGVKQAWDQEPLRASVDAGTGIFYDARTLHRGMGNWSETPRPCLVFRYDPCEYPPPQAGILRTGAIRSLAWYLNTWGQVPNICRLGWSLWKEEILGFK